MSGEFPERECDIEKLCLIVRHPGSETSLLGQHIHTTAFPRARHCMGSVLTNGALRAQNPLAYGLGIQATQC